MQPDQWTTYAAVLGAMVGAGLAEWQRQRVKRRRRRKARRPPVTGPTGKSDR